MELDLSRELSAERLPSPASSDQSLVSLVRDESMSIQDGGDFNHLSDQELAEKVQSLLLARIEKGDKNSLFQLGQLYFEQEQYEEAAEYLEQAAEHGDFQAMFQLAVMFFDGLAGPADHQKGFEYMMVIATTSSKKAQHLLRAAQYNIGRAYFQGYGVKQSDELAEKYWLLAADDGNPKACIKAQNVLGLFYSRPDSTNTKKAFFWHSEACGNGSLESQGALGVMLLNGLGCKKDVGGAVICLREAAERGNVYAMGNLVAYYYGRKLHTKTVELAARVSHLDNVDQIAQETECLPAFVRKGIALACFYYARCLYLGLAIKKDEAEAKKYYSKSYTFDPDVCARLQSITQKGEI